MKWPASVMVNRAIQLTMIGNSIAGSEKIGLITAGVPCDDLEATHRIRDNEVNANCEHFSVNR